MRGLVTLPDVSHFAPVQRPEVFNAAVLEFLGARSARQIVTQPSRGRRQ